MTKQTTQECFILINADGHPHKKNYQYFVYKSKWRAIVAAAGTTHTVKKLTIEL